MTRRRVVVTGLGLVSPVGNTVAEGWANILAGRSGIATVTRFDASNLACHFAGEVKIEPGDLSAFALTRSVEHVRARNLSLPRVATVDGCKTRIVIGIAA